jgi:TatD DNase family protein
MFSDTHFHLLYLAEAGLDLGAIFRSMAARNCAFALDIGTKCGDLPERLSLTEQLLRETGGGETSEQTEAARQAIAGMLHFSAGIWPAVEAIEERQAQVAILESHVAAALNMKVGAPFYGHLRAIGECGLDHHWNPSGVDRRSEADFVPRILRSEAELFEAQLELARRLALPVIVHSREAFEGTFDCIKNVGYDHGVIHCFSYGIDEARAFLERGWFISFAGGITYTKKSQMEDVKKLLRFVPKDRLLLETDAPYLAPVPFRGRVNTPVLVEHIYQYTADLLESGPETLSALVDANAKNLFQL